MEFIDENVCFLSLFPVQRHTVQYGIRYDQQSSRHELCAEAVDIKNDDSPVQIHVALLSEDIQRASGVEFQRERNLPCLRLRLAQEFLSKRT